jgi:hypothetical protein
MALDNRCEDRGSQKIADRSCKSIIEITAKTERKSQRSLVDVRRIELIPPILAPLAPTENSHHES